MTLSPRIKLIVALAIPLTFIGWLAGLYAFVNDIATMPMPKPVEKLDAIVVLTGGSNRIDAGFNLLEQGFGKKLLISGVGKGMDVKQLLKRWKAEPQKSLDCCVHLGFEADSTTGNAVETAEWLKKEGFHTIYLVTANYHIRRALLEFRRLAPDVAVTPYPIIPDKFDINIWWKDPGTAILVMHEYLKYTGASLRSFL